MKTYLDTFIDNANLTTDDGGTEVKFITPFSFPPFPLIKVFLDKPVDFIIAVGVETSEAKIDYDQTVYGYKEAVPLHVRAIDKEGITAVKLLEKAKVELRSVLETYPTGSQRSMLREEEATKRLGTTTIYGFDMTVNYDRDTT